MSNPPGNSLCLHVWADWNFSVQNININVELCVYGHTKKKHDFIPFIMVKYSVCTSMKELFETKFLFMLRIISMDSFL